MTRAAARPIFAVAEQGRAAENRVDARPVKGHLMPRFHFHLVSDCALIPDSEGVVLADPGAARREALLVAEELVKPGLPAQHRKWRGWSVQVADDCGREVLLVPVVELLGAVAQRTEPARKTPAYVGAHTSHRDGAPGNTARSTGGTGKEHYARTLHLTAEAIRHVERCRQLQQAIAKEVELARETARLSARLVEQWRMLPAGTPSN